MAVLDLTQCPICHAKDSLARQTTQLESRTHVTYECQECGTLLAWLGDEMWLEADRWSFQKVGRPERADLLYRSMTVAELRKLVGEKPPAYPVMPQKETSRPKAAPVWIDTTPSEAEDRFAEEPFEEVPLAPNVITAAHLAEEPEAPAPEEAQEATIEEPPLAEMAPAAVTGAAALTQEEAQPEAAPEPPVEAVAAAAVAGAATVAREEQVDEVPPVPEPSVAPIPAESPEPGEEVVAGPPTVQRSREERRRPPAAQRRRSRGSPFLVLSVALVLLCLISSAAAMVIYSLLGNWPLSGPPPTNPPVSEAMPTETAVPTDTPLPTQTPAPTDTPIPTNTPEPTATPPPMPTEAADVEFLGVTDYVSSTGSHYLVGEVLNRTVDTLRFVEVLATFYDAGGQLVGTGSTFTEVSIVEPGSTAPFKLITLNPPALDHYDLRVDYSTTTQPPIRLELLGHSGSAAESGRYYVSGEVRNPHDFTVKFPEIIVTYYNATHQVIRVEAAFAEVDPVGPGQSSPFEVVLADPPADLQHYTLQTEAVQQ